MKYRVNSAFRAGAAILLLIAGPAFAQSQPPVRPMTDDDINKVDTDRNGQVSQEEYVAFMNTAFRSLDKNKDGRLSASEMPGTVTSAQFSSLDADDSGSVSRQEFDTAMMTDFRTADRSGDGMLQ